MTIILRSSRELTTPIAGTPTLPEEPDITSDLFLDYTFDYLKASIADGAAIANLASQGGSKALTLGTAGGSLTKPKLKHSPFSGGRASLAYDGTNGIYGTGITVLEAGQPSTQVLCLKVDSVAHLGSSYTRLIAGSGTTNFRLVTVSGDGSPRLRTTGEAVAGQPLQMGQWVMLACTLAANGEATVRQNDGEPSLGTIANLQSHSGLYLGQGGSAALDTTLVGEISRVMVFGRALSSGDLSYLYELMVEDGYLP
jgi:hypothetical protein